MPLCMTIRWCVERTDLWFLQTHLRTISTFCYIKLVLDHEEANSMLSLLMPKFMTEFLNRRCGWEKWLSLYKVVGVNTDKLTITFWRFLRVGQIIGCQLAVINDDYHVLNYISLTWLLRLLCRSLFGFYLKPLPLLERNT